MSASIRAAVCLFALLLQGNATAQLLNNVDLAESRPGGPQPNLSLSWYNGVFQNIGSDIACLSDPPIVEIRTQAYSGFTLLPSNRTPAIGEVFYAHLVISHPGNPCAGSAVGVEMLLPAGVQPAASAGNPAFCFARVPPNANHPNTTVLFNLGNDAGYGCPQTFAQGFEGLRISAPNGGFGGGSWGMAQGVWLEFLIPLKTSQPHNGSQSIRFRVNPDIGVVGYPAVPFFATNDVLFRTSNEDNQLSLEICTVAPIPQGC
ncbi:MAG: hypothetical protein ABI411_19905 [Tahibacter sp.]